MLILNKNFHLIILTWDLFLSQPSSCCHVKVVTLSSYPHRRWCRDPFAGLGIVGGPGSHHILSRRDGIGSHGGNGSAGGWRITFPSGPRPFCKSKVQWFCLAGAERRCRGMVTAGSPFCASCWHLPRGLGARTEFQQEYPVTVLER